MCSSYKIHLCECLHGKVDVGLQIQPLVSEHQMNTIKPFMEDADTQLYKIKESISLQTLQECTCHKCVEKVDNCDCPAVQACGTSSDNKLECDCPLNKRETSEKISSENQSGEQKNVASHKKDSRSSPERQSERKDTIPLPPPSSNSEPST